MTDLANNTAAVAAGYVRTQTDAGATAKPRYRTHYAKPIAGEVDEGGYVLTADGSSDVSQAAADTAALAALNGQRVQTYGSGSSANKTSRTAASTKHFDN